MNVPYRVELSQPNATVLLSGGRHAARKPERAQGLLAADAGASDGVIARNAGAGGSTVYRTRRRFVTGQPGGAQHGPQAVRQTGGCGRFKRHSSKA
jgi:hypothetical protein